MIIKAPHSLEDLPKSLFLAGSIEMGGAEDWQKSVEEQLKHKWHILNPRRDNWNPEWKQDISNPEFKQQVVWELEALEKANTILMYLDPLTKSPISLLEFGLYARSRKLMVVCPEGFYRRGNIQVVCEYYNIPLFTSLKSALTLLK